LVDFLQCKCHGWLPDQFSGLQAAFGTAFSVKDSYWKARASFLKRVTDLREGYSQLISDFIEASRNFIFHFLHKQAKSIG
jgi:hypothetical protein